MQQQDRDGLAFFQTADGNPASYSAAARVGDLIYTAGQIGAEVGGPPVDVGEQVRTALSRLIAAVEAAGGGVETIVKINTYLADLNDFPLYDQIYRELVAVDPKPARTSVQIAAFPAPLKIEIDAVASIRDVEAK
ncbi:MAG: RidA family protein [Acidimicrobiia bacterium]